mmetsp:Transcript_26757/g.61649  ORF Transcript_26757/g.61649 Transcript_26757/m.61649 type:complete len:743 (+) Transcript_26757:84-2312(+)
MEVEFELSQQLVGHESIVRCATVLPDDSIVTGGWDAMVIVWRKSEEGYTMDKQLQHHSEPVTTLSASSSSPGAFYSGSKDKMAVKIDAEGNPVVQYVGHENVVTSIAENGAQVVTGAQDGKAKIWEGATGQLLHTLDAGAHAVTVAVMATGEIITGSQDAAIRVWRGPELIQERKSAHGDIIRAIHIGPQFLLTASNDSTMKLWSKSPVDEMGHLSGHASFVYHVVADKECQEAYSASDDSTMKVWSLGESQCKQSILHANSVWQVVALPNGDVVSCCADKVARIWTKDPARMATAAERDTQKEMANNAAMYAASKGSTSQPHDVQATDISEMPTTVGKKNGEIKLFRESDGKICAYTWQMASRSWKLEGEVVGSKESKTSYPGDQFFEAGEYDFVFSVDMGGNRGSRELPYNRGGNPLATAERFCAREQIDRSNMKDIREFIEKNAGEGGSSAAAPSTSAAPPQDVSTMFPLRETWQFKDGKFDALHKKLLEFNEQVDESMRLDAGDLIHLNAAVEKLKAGIASQIRPCEKDIVHYKMGEWPGDKLFPLIDLWRLFLLHPQSGDLFKGSDRGAGMIAKVLSLLASDINGPLGLCAARWFANTSLYQTNRYAVFDKRAAVIKGIEGAVKSTNKNVRLAAATVLLNFAIVLHEVSFPPKPWDAAFASEVCRLALLYLEGAASEDNDGVQRVVLALGTMLPRDLENGGKIKETLKAAGMVTKLVDLEKKVTSNVASEVRRLLSM